MPNFCSLGSGALDVHGCLKACAEIGIEYVVVEQDFMHALSPMEATGRLPGYEGVRTG